MLNHEDDDDTADDGGDDGGDDGADDGELFSQSRDVELAFSPGGSEGAMQVMKKVETAFRWKH